MKTTSITKTKNGQYLTTVPKAWLKSASNYEYWYLEWSWEWVDNREGLAVVKLIDSRCDDILSEDGVNYQCTLEHGHKEEHEYDDK